jgi:glycine/D-amino acid oxidase-like deaminating enzyme
VSDSSSPTRSTSGSASSRRSSSARSRRGSTADDVPELATNYFGYLYLAADPTFARVLKANQQLQASWGAATRILDRDELAAAFPFYNLDDIVCGSHNPLDEGYFDGGTMFDTFRTHAQRNGVTYHQAAVTGSTNKTDGWSASPSIPVPPSPAEPW